jgi:hypothetical protein
MKKRTFILLFALVCFSCSKEEKKEDVVSFPQRTVLIYMAADNSLYKNAKTDIQEILKNQAHIDGNLLVYLDAPSWSVDPYPQLFHIQSGQLQSVKQYSQHNSASGEVLRGVIEDAMTMFRAESYGLVLWSHGTGWLPENSFDELKKNKSIAAYSSCVKSFGKDTDNEISIMDLANALPVKFEYIIFDACLMGSIEVCYQLRNKANTIIASPTETLVDGFPYDKIIPFLFGVTPCYAEIARSYMSYYKNKTGILQSATIAVIDTKQLEPFAATLREIAANDGISILTNKEKIQPYDMLNPSVFYDLQDYLEQIIHNEQYLTSVKQQLSKMVIYNDFTPYFLTEYPIKNSCGISIYISSGNNALDEHYKLLDWYIDSKINI